MAVILLPKKTPKKNMAEIAKWRKYANMIKAKRTNNVNAKKTAKSDAVQKNGGASQEV